MQTKTLLFTLSFFVGVNIVYGQEASLLKTMETVFFAFKTHDYQMLQPLLADSVNIPPIPKGMGDKLFPQMFRQLPSPETYVITSTVSEGRNTRVLADFTSGGKTLHYNFLFNSKNKIMEVDLTKSLKIATKKLEPADSVQSIIPDRLVIPFEIHNGLLFVKATVDGQSQTFILDSGAPSLVINTAHLPSEGVGSNQQISSNVFGVNGIIGKVNISKIAKFNWQTMELTNLSALTMDLSHLEKETNRHFFGLIGYDVFKNYEITFNYKDKILTLTKVDNQGNIGDVVTSTNEPLCTLTFDTARHIPIIPMTIGDRTFRVGIDCGAWTNLLSTRYLSVIKPYSTKFKDDKLTGADKEISIVKKTRIKSSSIGCTNSFDCSTVFSDTAIDQLKSAYHVDIDGLIGYEFLKQHIVSINFKKKTLKIFS